MGKGKGKGKGKEVGSLIHIFVIDGTKPSAMLTRIAEKKKFIFFSFVFFFFSGF